MRSDGTKSRSGISHVICGADFETDNDGATEAWVVQWAFVRMSDRSSNKTKYTERHGYKLQEFTSLIDSLLEQDKTEYFIYFHNLKYDMQFMRAYLCELQNRYPDDHMFIIRKGKPIILRIKNVEFRDSSNKMPAGTTVKRMGEMIGIPKLESPRGDFRAGWSKDLTDDDFQYVIHDALIVGTMMQARHRMGHKRATSSGDAWASLKATYNKHHNTNGYGEWKYEFPELSYEMDAWLRPGYFGGINISQHIGYIDGEITHEDVNSMYPTVMMYDPLPKGTPYRITTNPIDEGFELFVIKARMKFKLRKGMIPCFRFKFANDRAMEGMSSTDYVVNTSQWHLMTLTNIDMENFSRFYDIKIDPENVEYVGFDAEIGANKEYLDYWFKVKSEAPKNSVERLSAKLMLNSAYGRFGMSPEMEDCAFVMDEELKDCVLKATESISETVPGYLPYAMFVTAHARRRLLDCVLAVGCENVIHCDTDSVIHKGPPSSLGHTDALGDWGIESQPVRMLEGGVKRYVELHREPRTLRDVSFTCAGVPQRDIEGCPVGMWLELLDHPERLCDAGYELGRLDYRIESEWLRELLIGHGRDPDHQNTMKLLPKRVKGGVILTETTFKIHDVMITRFK